MKPSYRSLFLLTAAALLTGCADVLPHYPTGRVNAEKQRAARHRARRARRLESVAHPYLAGSGFAMAPHKPAWLTETVTIRESRKESLYHTLGLVARATRIKVGAHGLALPLTGKGGSSSSTIQPGVRIPGLVHARLSYRGTLVGLLNTIDSLYGVWWTVTANRQGRPSGIRFFRFESRTYHVDLSVQSQTISNTISAQGGVGSSGGGASGGAAPGAAGVSGASVGSGLLSVKAKGVLDPYKDVLAGLQSLVNASAGGGLVAASPSVGTVTVLATPPVQRLARQYLRVINNEATRNISVSVRVYSVNISNNNTIGGSINAAFKVFQNNLTGSVSGVTIPSTLGTGLSSLSLLVPSTATGGAAQGAGTQGILQALASVGQVRLVTSGTAVTSNGEPAPIQTATQVGYLASSGTTLAANVGSSTTLTPGTVTVGFTSNFLPELLSRNRVRLEYSLQISALKSLDTITSGTSSIQVPTVNEQSAAQTVVMRSGQTLVLAGFGQTQKARDAGVGLLSGYAGHNTTRDWLVILIHIDEVRS